MLDSRRLLDEGLLGDEDYRAFVAVNVIRLHAESDPAFFDGTAIEAFAWEVGRRGPRPQGSGGLGS